MSNFSKHQRDRNRFVKCEICLSSIPVEHYFGRGEKIICYECGTLYTIISKNPVQVRFVEERYDYDDVDDTSTFVVGKIQ